MATSRSVMATSRSVMATSRRAARPWLMVLLGLVGVAAGLALPFTPVWAQTTTLTWPVPGPAVRSSTAIVVPYRPTDLVVTVPCSALRAPGVVFATGTGSDGLVVTGDAVQFDGRRVPLGVVVGVDCRAVITAGPDGVSVLAPDGRRTDLPDQPVPKVFGFRTDLTPADAAGLTATVGVTDPFETSPGPLKIVLIAVQVLAAGSALAVLFRASRRRRRSRLRWRPVWWIDLAVVAVLAGWAVIGPLAVDDGWATMIARNVADTGSPGNYYRWWNAAEVPFALGQELLAPLTHISIAPLWLRLPSTVFAIATWLALSRGVLGALPIRSATGRVRLLAAVFLLAAWLPFNLGVRPESLVALGVTVVLALAMRVRTVAGLGAVILAAALTVPISPNGVLVAAPILVFAPRLLTALRASAPTRPQLVAHVLLLSCVGTLTLTLIFADQSWDALVTATDWHTFFGPSLPWYDEPVRYRHLLQADQQGSFAKRLPVLSTVAMLPVVLLLACRHRDRDVVGRAAIRLAGVTVLATGLFALSPSKWSYHLGAAAGLFAALLTVAVVLVAHRARLPTRYRVTVGLGGSALLIAAVTVAFHGPNAWWLPAMYDVPWAAEAPRPLDDPLVWVAVVVAVSVMIAFRRHDRRVARALTRAPAVVAVTAVGVLLVLLIGSFVAAPLRQPQGALAMANLHHLTGSKACGLADEVQVLPDGPVLARSADGVDQLAGFIAQGGYLPGAPPPDLPGTGTSTFLWGSRSPDAHATGTLTSAWFLLPPQPADGGVAVSLSGRTDDGNRLALEFGRSDGGGIVALGARAPDDRPAADEDPDHPLWRTVGVDGVDIPVGADRVRITATDGRTDDFGWLAVTGPRLRSIVPLNRFLADHGPVLIGWPQSFLFPCVRDIARVSGGVAQTPRAVLESPRPWLSDDRNATIGGTFHALVVFGELHEIPTRLAGAPNVDWGSLLVAGDNATHDAYLRTVRRDLVPGLGGVARVPPEH